jgi:hypothetical protein
MIRKLLEGFWLAQVIYFYMDARGDLVGPTPSLQRSRYGLPAPRTFGVVGGWYREFFYFRIRLSPLCGEGETGNLRFSCRLLYG